jgi:hypothetical protein
VDAPALEQGALSGDAEFWDASELLRHAGRAYVPNHRIEGLEPLLSPTGGGYLSHIEHLARVAFLEASAIHLEPRIEIAWVGNLVGGDEGGPVSQQFHG